MYKVIDDIPVWGEHEPDTLAQIQRCASDDYVGAAALMADGHKGYSMPIGGVVGYYHAVSPSGVGYDIACGLKGVRTDIRADELRPGIGRALDEISRRIAFGVGRTSGENVDHEIFDDPTWRDIREVGTLRQLARQQLGAVGSGNHFVDILEDEDGWIWVSAHFGSRGLGHRIASGFLNLAAGRPFDAKAPGESMDQPATVLSLHSPLGQSYLRAMALAGRYAYAGRDYVVGQVLGILGTTATEEVHNNHNYCVAGTERLPTPGGYKKMAEIAAGDVIYAYDPQAGLVRTTVTAQWRSGRKPIYTIATASRRIHVSGDHPVLTIGITTEPHPHRPWFKKGVGRYVWKLARDLTIGDTIVCVEGYNDHTESLQPGLARFIGAYLGDGWVRSKPARQGYSVGLAIGDANAEHTSRYLDLARSLWPRANWKNNARGAFGLSCSDKAVYQRLAVLGLTARSSMRRVPRIAFALPHEEKLELMSGYVDADGSVSNDRTTNHGRCKVYATSGELVEEIRYLAIACGLQATNTRSEMRQTNYGASVVHSFTLGAGAVRQLDLWHLEKRSNIRTVGRYGYRLQPSKVGYLHLPACAYGQRVRSIEVSDAEDVYDLSVDHPSHSFVCEGMVVHNCWQETHDGEEMMVVRKGATPAWPGQKGFVGGSMGDISVVVEGVDTEEARAALRSTIHGAGRVMSRRRAAGRVRWRKDEHGRRVQEVIRPGEISREMMADWLRRAGVELRGAGTDESPHVYRRLPDVLAAHAGSIRVLHTLHPLGVVMAGEDVFDPYKD